MNIKDAKEQIKNAITAYFTKDASGEYILPVEKQRPVFLMGPPGIGKTAIMEQIASEMGVGLLSYSMTHHTRQSALGLPFIARKTYNGKEYEVSEYTMSEIIAAVYDLMEESGIREGILFLDEINCVSETLAPIMLQFLQYKVFGRHRVPEGWIVVTAGNPPEYNNSVREFDIVTWDRLKRIDVEPDFGVWKEYAYERGVHPAILSYLEIEKQSFYRVESTVDGKTFITARGWEDLSQMLRLYELHGIPADGRLISQYVQNPKISRHFAAYYDLFVKYRSDYQIDKILEGKCPPDIIDRAKAAKFDERLSLLGLLLDAVGGRARETMEKDAVLTELMHALRDYKVKLAKPASGTPEGKLAAQIEKMRDKAAGAKAAGSQSRESLAVTKQVIEELEGIRAVLMGCTDGTAAFAEAKAAFDREKKALEKLAKGSTAKAFANAFLFLEQAFGGGQEMLIFVTELTQNPVTARYISKYGCNKYYEHNKDLLFYERQKEIDRVVEKLEL